MKRKIHFGVIAIILMNGFLFFNSKDALDPNTQRLNYFQKIDMLEFNITTIETKMQLDVEYFARSLRLTAYLTDIGGVPVANETINFSYRINTGHITDGWVPIGSKITSNDGSAEMYILFVMPSGSYSARARHTANENFGLSEKICTFEIPGGIPEFPSTFSLVLPLLALLVVYAMLKKKNSKLLYKNCLRNTCPQ